LKTLEFQLSNDIKVMLRFFCAKIDNIIAWSR